MLKKLGKEEGDEIDTVPAAQSQGDGTQIRTYINCVEIKVSAKEALKTGQDNEDDQSELLV